MTDTATLEAQNAQREDAKAKILDASPDGLRRKQRAEDRFSLVIDGEPMAFHFVSIGGRRYDRLIDECPPTMEQRADGATYDESKLAPKLLSEVSRTPKMSEDEWNEIVWKSEDWSRGERMQLFGRAVTVCLKGLDVGPTEAG